jgi:hypothetical protein
MPSEQGQPSVQAPGALAAEQGHTYGRRGALRGDLTQNCPNKQTGFVKSTHYPKKQTRRVF